MLEKTQSTEIENIYNRNKNKYILEKVSKNIFFISSFSPLLGIVAGLLPNTQKKAVSQQ